MVRYKTLLAPVLLVFACSMACNTVTERTTSPRLRIAIRPPVPKTADQLECLVYRESAENVYEYTWDLDNVVVAPAGSDAPHVVPSSETLTGQNTLLWSADGSWDQSPYWSESIANA